MLRIAICDDDRQCVLSTKETVASWAEKTNHQTEISCFESGDDLIEYCRKNPVDLIFLDIIMPLRNGIDAGKELRSENKAVKIVFLTSSPEFALESYSVKAADYCIKPVSDGKIREILDECSESCGKESKSLIVKASGKYNKILLSDIEYIEAQNKSVLFSLKSGKRIEVLEPLYYFENQLAMENCFCKCHRSYIVNIHNVDYFNSVEIKTKFGKTVPISRSFAKNFHDTYFLVMFHN